MSRMKGQFNKNTDFESTTIPVAKEQRSQLRTAQRISSKLTKTAGAQDRQQKPTASIRRTANDMPPDKRRALELELAPSATQAHEPNGRNPQSQTDTRNSQQTAEAHNRQKKHITSSRKTPNEMPPNRGRA